MPGLFPISERFRSARDGWWSARAAGGMSSGASKVARKAARKEERWTLSGERYLRAYRGLDGGLIRVPSELAELTEELIASIAPRLARAFDSKLGALAEKAWEEWPVDTGLSKSLLDLEYEQIGESFVGRFISRAPYTVFIKSKTASEKARIDEKARKKYQAIAENLKKKGLTPRYPPLAPYPDDYQPKSGKKPGGSPVYQTLIRRPGRTIAMEILDALEKDGGPRGQ